MAAVFVHRSLLPASLCLLVMKTYPFLAAQALDIYMQGVPTYSGPHSQNSLPQLGGWEHARKGSESPSALPTLSLKSH